MLPAAARLRRRPEFTRTVRSGNRARRSRLVLHLLPADPAASASAPVRAGFVVGRVVGPAVVRNRVRRRLRHVVRERLAMLQREFPGSTVVVRALPEAATATSAQLAADVDAALGRLRRTGPTGTAGLSPEQVTG